MEKMSRQLPLNPTFIPPPYGVLRSLLENPLKLPLHHEDGERCPPGCPALGRNNASGTPSWAGHPRWSIHTPPSLPPAPRPCFDEIEELTYRPIPPPQKGEGTPSLSNV